MTRPSIDAWEDEAETRGIEWSERDQYDAQGTRREAFDAVTHEGEPLALEALAAVVADERQANSSDASASCREVLNELHHVHLPKLDQAGIVDYDAEANRLELSGDDEVSSG